MKLTLTHYAKAIIACGLLLAVIAWVECGYSWKNTLSNWSQVEPSTLSLAIALVCLSHFLRASRLYFAYNKFAYNKEDEVNFKRTLGVSFVHNTLSYLFPMRLGEIALPALSKLQLQVDLKYSTATLILIRLFDAHVLLLLLCFFAGSLWLGDSAFWLPLFLIILLPLVMHLFKKISAKIPKLRFAYPLYSHTKTWLRLYCYTVFIWTIKLYALAVLAAKLGGISIGHAWVATIIADGSALSPVTGIANAGTFEVAFTLPLTPLGYNTGKLVKAAVNLHLFILVINIFVGSFGALLLDKRVYND